MLASAAVYLHRIDTALTFTSQTIGPQQGPALPEAGWHIFLSLFKISWSLETKFQRFDSQKRVQKCSVRRLLASLSAYYYTVSIFASEWLANILFLISHGTIELALHMDSWSPKSHRASYFQATSPQIQLNKSPLPYSKVNRYAVVNSDKVCTTE